MKVFPLYLAPSSGEIKDAVVHLPQTNWKSCKKYCQEFTGMSFNELGSFIAQAIGV